MKQLYYHANRQRSERTRRFYARVELAYTVVDLLAALCYIAGSVLLFLPRFETGATCFFVAGSCLFAVKPTMRFWREIRLAQIGEEEELMSRL